MTQQQLERVAVIGNGIIGHGVAQVFGPLESADVGGLYTIYHFGASLMPHLDTAPLPADAVRRLVEDGANGLANGRGVHDWSKRDGQALMAARFDELFRWLKVDKEKA
jgi:3-hydroxybutyryl-CoA dehydrogenase